MRVLIPGASGAIARKLAVRLAAEGHRVVIVVACDGDMWASPDQGGRRASRGPRVRVLRAADPVYSREEHDAGRP